ncbi:hypothetical protein BHE74_00007126 [Ensete ventricosum]|nr:hypothetical protein BHE74_00007126 [Ensete ventricosum]
MVKVDFSDHVSLAKKEGTSMAGKGGSTRGMRQQKRWSISYRWTAEWRTDRVGADCRGRRHRYCRAVETDRRISLGKQMTIIRT